MDKYFRPLELEVLQGSNLKAKEKLNWEPKVKFKDLMNTTSELVVS